MLEHFLIHRTDVLLLSAHQNLALKPSSIKYNYLHYPLDAWVTFVYIHRIDHSSLPVYLVIRVIVIPRASFLFTCIRHVRHCYNINLRKVPVL